MKRLTNLTFLTSGVLVMLMLTLAGCGDFLDVNTDPNAATTGPADELFTEAVLTQQSQRGIELLVNAPLLSQHWASHNSAGGLFLLAERYNLNGADFTFRNSWEFYYTNGLSDLEQAVNGAMSGNVNRVNAVAQARLMQAYIFYQLTVQWGEVPFSQALNTEFPNPAFDSQEEVLRGLVTRIDEAVTLIDPDDPSEPIVSGDPIFDGDMESWERFGNSLKLRVLMLLYNKDNSVASEIQSLLDSAPLIRNNSENAEFPYVDSPDNENQFWQLHQDFAGGGPAFGGGSFFFAGEVLVDLMNDNSDPRRATYFEPNFEGNFAGVPAGTGPSQSGPDSLFSEIGGAINRPAFPGRMLTASEVYLHEAEFLLRSGGSETEARTALQEGIRSSMNFFDGLDGEIDDADMNTYITDRLNEFDNASNDRKIEIVQEEHYVDVYEKTPENWALWKRTKVPTLSLPQNAALSDIARRYPYPTDERSANTSFPENPPSLDTPMWYEN